MTAAAARPIQIWQPDGARWVRPPVGPFGDHYSAEPVIHRRRGTERRVVLIGESVATGYLYAPHYTPAKHLRSALPRWDVIDLARTNESLASLVETAHQATQLEPDAVVMWAGNNWMLRDLGHLSPYHPHASHRAELGRVLSDSGLAGVAEATAAWVRPAVLSALADLHTTVTNAGARLIVIVPEVNLLDWEHAEPVTVLPDGNESTWHRAHASGDHLQMAQLDGGYPAPRVSSQAQTGDSSFDLESLRREVDVSCGPLRATTSSPMVTQQVQDLLREWATDNGIATVDVPALIAASNGRPDRTWFLDYCHHTSDAIAAIVTAIAHKVDADDVTATDEPVPGELQAVAALGALMHTDHRLAATGDRRPLLRHWRREAERSWPNAHELIRDLIESRLGSAPVPLTEAQRRNRLRPYPFGFAHGWRPHTTEADALEALGVTPTDLEQIRLPAERAWPSAQMWRPGQRLWIDEQPFSASPGYCRSIVPRAHFGLLARKAEPLHLALTARAPSGGSAMIEFGRWSTAIPLGATWSTHQLTIPPDATDPGLQPLQITWPDLHEGPERWRSMLADLVADRTPQLQPVFGEVFSLRVNSESKGF